MERGKRSDLSGRLARGKRRRAWRGAVAAGACAVALGVTCALILPGVTLEGSLSGGAAIALPEERREQAPEENPQAAEAVPAVEIVDPAEAAEPPSPGPETSPAAETPTPAEPVTSPAAETVALAEPEPVPIAMTAEEPGETPAPSTEPDTLSPETAETPPEDATEPVETPAVEALSEETALLPVQEMTLAAENAIAPAAETAAPRIAKEGVQDGNIVTYTLTVNPNGEKLNDGALRLTDTLTYYTNAADSAFASFVPGSVRVWRTYLDGTEKELGQDSFPYTTTTSITETSSWFLTRYHYTHVLELSIPDGAPLRITYQVALNGTNQTLFGTNYWNLNDFQNNAVLNDAASSSAAADLGTVQVPRQTDDSTAVTLHTVDSGNISLAIPNVSFTLQKWDGSGYQTVQTLTTDETGTFTFTDGAAPVLEHKVGYRLLRGQAPEGYKTDDTPVDFYINCGFSHTGSLPAYTGGVTMINSQDDFYLTFERTYARVTVKASWLTPEGNQDTAAHDPVLFTLLQETLNADGAPLSETVIGEFSIPAEAWAWYSYETEETKALPLADTVDGREVTYRYKVKEGVRVPGYIVTCDNTVGVSTGAITIFLRRVYVLPNTGGSGPGGIWIAGAALTLGAGYLLYRQRKRKGGPDPPG